MVTKENVVQAIEHLLHDRIRFLREEMSALQGSIAGETKSSMGDKYETARAQGHIEMEKLAKRLSETRSLITLLKQAELTTGNETIGLGNLVNTTLGVFFLGCGIGRIDVNGQSVYAISTGAPIAKQMLNKKASEIILVNGKKVEILAIAG